MIKDLISAIKLLLKVLIELNEMLDLIHTQLVDLNFNMTHYWEDKDND